MFHKDLHVRDKFFRIHTAGKYHGNFCVRYSGMPRRLPNGRKDRLAIVRLTDIGFPNVHPYNNEKGLDIEIFNPGNM